MTYAVAKGQEERQWPGQEESPIPNGDQQPQNLSGVIRWKTWTTPFSQEHPSEGDTMPLLCRITVGNVHVFSLPEESQSSMDVEYLAEGTS